MDFRELLVQAVHDEEVRAISPIEMTTSPESSHELYRDAITRLSSALLELTDISPVPLTEIEDSLEKLDIRTTESEYATVWNSICKIVTDHLGEATTISHCIDQYNDDAQTVISSIYPLSGSGTTYAVLTIQYTAGGDCIVQTFHRPHTTQPLQRFLPETSLEELDEQKITTLRDRTLDRWG